MNEDILDTFETLRFSTLTITYTHENLDDLIGIKEAFDDLEKSLRKIVEDAEETIRKSMGFALDLLAAVDSGFDKSNRVFDMTTVLSENKLVVEITCQKYLAERIQEVIHQRFPAND